jgi:hypothetical protein
VSALELRVVRPPIARVFGATRPDGGYRIAPDEWLLLGDDAAAALADVDPYTIDFSSGFMCLELSGPGWERAFAYLSDLVLPDERPALVQGNVAEVAAKAIVGVDDLLLLVPPHVAHHVRDEILGLVQVGFTVEEVRGAERAPA